MLAWLPRVQVQCSGRGCLPAVCEKRADSRLPPARRESQHHSFGAFHEPKADRRRAALDGQRNAAHDRCGQLEDEPRHSFEIDTRTLKPLGHRAAIREHVRISREENRDLPTLPCEANDLVGVIERADIRAGSCVVQESRATTVAVADDVGFLDRFDRLDGRETRVSGTDTHEPDSAPRTHDEEVRAFGKPRSRLGPTAFALPHPRRLTRARASHRLLASVPFRWLARGLDSSARVRPPARLPLRSTRVQYAEQTTNDFPPEAPPWRA